MFISAMRHPLQFFRYFYYRWAHAMMNFGWSKKYSYYCAWWNTGGSIAFSFGAILLTLAYLIVGKLQREAVYLLIIPFTVLGGIFENKVMNDNDNERFYHQLDEKYKGEKYRVVKGCLVFLYYLISLFGFLAVSILVTHHN